MERVWAFERLAVTMRRVDFLDPALVGQPEVRERGVRLEIKPMRTQAQGSVYASDVMTLDRALCRLDFLESGPGRADRMHWHPEMANGEPGDRVFDVGMPADPRAWLTNFLRSVLPDYLSLSAHDVTAYTDDLAAIGETADEIGRGLDEGLAWAREPWPDAEHDDRGMAVAG
ncbi:MAG: hypothetical protein J2P22_04680 [Nocardioides sp.]|nr:hypothetical protein [Nocardioides sp.]